MAGSVDYNVVFRQSIRMINIIRNPRDGDLLTQLLGDVPVSVENATKLLVFARKYMWEGPDYHREPIFPRIEEACIEYLKANNAPVPPHSRPPLPGEPGFHSVLEEFES